MWLLNLNVKVMCGNNLFLNLNVKVMCGSNLFLFRVLDSGVLPVGFIEFKIRSIIMYFLIQWIHTGD